MSLKRALAHGPVLGSFVGLGDPAVPEIMGWRGFDVLCIDAEHGCLGPTEVEALVRGCDVARVPSLVRVPGVGTAIGHALEAGASGVVVPRIESAAEAEECAALVRYPPLGRRGAGIGRASRFGLEFSRQLREANDDVVLVVQIETAPGVEAAPEIAAVDGVDVVFVGPGDLAVSLGCDPGSDEHTTTIRTVLAAADDRGTTTGIFCLVPEQVAAWRALGVRLFLLGSDLGFLGAGCDAAVAAGRAALGDAEPA
jgi:4-hydroxy-2-oxoheptanedioate aldolase